jgi:hypothetical protein
MRTAAQCLAKAVEMDTLALFLPYSGTTSEFERLAVMWRQLAKQAAWQDSFPVFSAG